MIFTHFYAHFVSMYGCVGVGTCVIASKDGYGITTRTLMQV